LMMPSSNLIESETTPTATPATVNGSAITTFNGNQVAKIYRRREPQCYDEEKSDLGLK
jgi:hypothetical protein